MPPTLYTIGHSTHTLEELVAILTSHRIEAIADVRQFPGSRRLPWFNAENLATALPKAGIQYWPFRSLGGRRKTRADSPNTGWRNASFRGYADYMQTPEFASALDELQTQARTARAALMCAEAVPWRCHRSLISDALLVRRWTVLDIFDAAHVKPHALTSFAKVSGQQIIYPPDPAKQPELFPTETPSSQS